MIEISTDRARLDVPLIHRFLSEESAWAAGIGLPLVTKGDRQFALLRGLRE